MMHKMLVVDDEYMILEGMKHLLLIMNTMSRLFIRQRTRRSAGLFFTAYCGPCPNRCQHARYDRPRNGSTNERTIA